MVLTVSKRLEFSASRRLFLTRLSDAENLAAFGPETSARYGTGRNYVAFFIFSGEVDNTNGMLVNISEIKERVQQILHAHFDHKFLNEDHPAFADVAPTAENVARQLFAEVSPLFNDSNAEMVACHLIETPDRSATVYSSGMSEANYWFGFSAARQTMNCVAALRSELDHKNLNNDVIGLTNRPITTESIACYIHERAAGMLPIHRVRLHERDDFFAEYWSDGNFFLGMQMPFSAAHRLHAASLSDAENLALYGKCNHPRGHGHLYLTETTIGGEYDQLSGTVCNFTGRKNFGKRRRPGKTLYERCGRNLTRA